MSYGAFRYVKESKSINTFEPGGFRLPGSADVHAFPQDFVSDWYKFRLVKDCSAKLNQGITFLLYNLNLDVLASGV